MLRSGNMGLRLGPTTKTWRLDDYMEDETLWGPGHSTAATGSKIKKEGGRSRRPAKDRKHGHSMTPLGSEPIEGPRTSHEREEKVPSSPHQETTPVEVDKGKGRVGSTPAWITSYDWRDVVTSVVYIILLYIIILLACLGFFSGDKASVPNAQPRSSLRNVLQCQDLILAKSHSDSVCFALHGLPSGLPLDSAGSEISFDEPRFAIDDVASKLSRGIQQVDLLGSLIGRQLSPSIKANVYTDNCSLVASIRPIAQTAQVQFRDALDAFNEILSSCDHTTTALIASHLGVQQAMDHAEEELRSWETPWKSIDKDDGAKKRRDNEEMKTSRGILHDAIESLSSVKEIVNHKVGRYRRSSAEFDILVENLDMMARTEGSTQSRCGIAEAEVVERQLKVTVSQASSDVEGTQNFEEYYNAI